MQDPTLQFHADGTFCLFLGSSSDSSSDRIWTYYDKQERKHFLQVQKGDLVGRYLLQDNTKPAWQDDSSKTSLPEKIGHAVNDMIDKMKQ